MISKESELHHSIGSLIDGAHPSPRTDRDYLSILRGVVDGGCRSLVAEHWWLKPRALGLIPGCTTFFSFTLPFQRSLDSNGPDNLYRSLNLGEPHLSCSLCCNEARILSKSLCVHVSVCVHVRIYVCVFVCRCKHQWHYTEHNSFL